MVMPSSEGNTVTVPLDRKGGAIMASPLIVVRSGTSQVFVSYESLLLGPGCGHHDHTFAA